MKRILYIFLFIFGFLFSSFVIHAQGSVEPVTSLSDELNNTERVEVGSVETHSNVSGFIKTFESFFITDDPNTDDVPGIFYSIAYSIKNVVIMLAILFLVIGVLKLFFSDSDEAAWEKWKKNIIWTSIGVLFMQLAFSFFNVFAHPKNAQTGGINAALSWEFWNVIIAPIIGFILMISSAVFLLMMFFAFYTIITGAGEEEKYKKGRSTFIFAVLGFMLIQLPQKIVSALYGRIPHCAQDRTSTNIWSYATNPCSLDTGVNTSEALGLVGKIFTTFNTFLTLICVILGIYAGFLILTSRGDESKVTKAKKIFIYIVIGFIILIASHAIFAFLINSASVH